MVTAGQGTGAEGSLFARASPLMAARLASAAVTFFIPLVLARTLRLAEYGTYKQFLLIAQTLYYTLPLGVPQALYYFVPRAEQRRPYFVQTLGFLLAAGAVAGAVILSLGGPIAHFFSNPELYRHRWSLALYVFGLIGSFPLEVSLTSSGRTRHAAVAYLVSDGVRAVAMTVPALLGFGVTGVMVCLAAFALARQVVTCVLVVRSSRGPWWRRGLFFEQLAYAAPFGAAVAIAIPQQYAHQYAVSALVSPEAFALYAVGCFQLPFIDLLYTPTSEVLMVRLGELDRAGRKAEGVRLFRKASAALALAVLPVAVFFFGAAPDVIAALFGDRFVSAAPLFRIGLAAVVLAALPVDAVLRACGHTRHILLANALKAVVTVPLLWFGVKTFGMRGALASWVVVEYFGKAVLLAKVPRALGEGDQRARFGDLLPLSEMGRALVGVAFAAAGVVGLRAAMHPALGWMPNGHAARVVALAAAGLAFGTAYLVALRWAGLRLSPSMFDRRPA